MSSVAAGDILKRINASSLDFLGAQKPTKFRVLKKSSKSCLLDAVRLHLTPFGINFGTIFDSEVLFRVPSMAGG